jgi:predicted site-specific integrase-resolvase
MNIFILLFKDKTIYIKMDIEYVNTKKAKEILQVTVKTLRIWDKEGKIRTIRTPSNIRRYNLKDIQNIISYGPPDEEKEKICYCRVSSRKQMDDLKRQEDFFRTKFPNHILVTDVGSGINWKRKGLKTILDKAMHGDISEIVVAHRDRLCRFAFELLEWIFERNGVKLLVLDEEKGHSSDQELADDILSIIHVYSCRKMGQRRYKDKDKKDTVIPNTETTTSIETMDG